MVKRTFKLISLVLAISLLLTGCSMIEVDKSMDDAEVIIKVNDTELVKKDVMKAYDNYKANMQYQYQLYTSMGYSMTMPTDDELKQNVVDSLVLQEVRKQKAAEFGLDKLTDDDLKKINETAQSDYDSTYSQVKTNVTKDGMTDDQIKAAADEFMTKNNITLDEYVKSAKEQYIDDKLDEYIYKDLTVSDDEVKQEYDTLSAADKTAYESDNTAIDTKINSGETVYYYPAGYRYVKHILIKFTDDDTKAISDIQTQISDLQKQMDVYATAAPTAAPEATAADANATVDPNATIAPTEQPTAEPTVAPTADPAATAVPTMDPALPTQMKDLTDKLAAAQQKARDDIQQKVDEAYKKATSGEDFDSLITEYGQDDGMTTEPGKTYGYVVGQNTRKYVTAFQDASMALAKVGDISQPVESAYGMHIIKYASDIPEGAAELTDYLKTTIRDDLLSKKKESEKTAKEDEWKKAANIETHVDRMVVYD